MKLKSGLDNAMGTMGMDVHKKKSHNITFNTAKGVKVDGEERGRTFVNFAFLLKGVICLVEQNVPRT